MNSSRWQITSCTVGLTAFAKLAQLEPFVDHRLPLQIANPQVDRGIIAFPIDCDFPVVFAMEGLWFRSMLIACWRSTAVQLIETAGRQVVQWITDVVVQDGQFRPMSITTDKNRSIDTQSAKEFQ